MSGELILIELPEDMQNLCAIVQGHLSGYWKNQDSFHPTAIGVISMHMKNCPVCQAKFTRIQEDTQDQSE